MERSDRSVQIESLVFRYGRDMAPEAIAAETPGARFVARARLVGRTAPGTVAGEAMEAGARSGESAESGADVGMNAIWGILLIQPEPLAARTAADVITDDGRVTHATVLTDAAALADLEAVVTQARYWELAPSYIDELDRLRADHR